MKDLTSISCVIPTYNGVHLLQKHLASVFEALRTGDEVIIADDASTDTTVKWLTDAYSLKSVPDDGGELSLFSGIYAKDHKKINVLLMVNKENKRFAQTVNRAVVFSQHQYFFLVNNDVSLQKKTLDILKEKVTDSKNIFAIGCLEYEQTTDGKKSGKNKLWFEKGIFQHSKADNFDSGPTAWASGGSAIFSTEKWRELGGFDAAFYPAYWEDIDVSFRARQKGWKVMFEAEAVVFHKHESTNAAVFGSKPLENISWKNAFTFTWKHANLGQKISFLIWYPYWQMQRMKADRA